MAFKLLLLLLMFILVNESYPVLAGTAFCSYEHTSKYSSDLINDQISGYMCKLDLDVKGDRVNDIGGSHEGGERDSQVDIIKVLPDFYTYLTSFPTTFCSKFKKLEIIDMCRADIATIELNSLNECKDLRILQLYMNKIEHVPENLMAENKKLLKLYISYNEKIKSLPENLLSGLSLLTLLDLSYNTLDHLPDSIFRDLRSLEDLNLERNNLNSIEPTLFESLGKLKKLNLNGNGISELPPAVFAELSNLKELHLRENKLTTIHGDSFPQKAQIDTVVLSKNKINAIDEYFIDNCGISNLKMGGNVCDKTGSIKKKDLKTILRTCFDNYNNEVVEQPPKPTTTTTTTTSTTTTTTPKPTTTTSTTTTTPKPTTTTTTTPKPTTTTSTTTPKPTTTTSTTTTTPKPTTPVPVVVATQTPDITKLQAVHEPCGIAKAGVENIVGGIEIAPHTHPWIAVLIYKGQYICGGTIVTKKKVVTAAHCIYSKDLVQKETENFVVILGAHQLDTPMEVGRVSVGVESIHLHKNWNPMNEKFDGDIAVLVLNDEVEFGYYIQPACITRIVGTLKDYNDGIVVGFGKSENSVSNENKPRKASTPIRKADECYREFPRLTNIASHRTFCGGNANGTGSCTGDSGGGLTVVSDGRHFLRGIVSASLHDAEYGCDVKSYAIYTDMRFYVTFINSIK